MGVWPALSPSPPLFVKRRERVRIRWKKTCNNSSSAPFYSIQPLSLAIARHSPSLPISEWTLPLPARQPTKQYDVQPSLSSSLPPPYKRLAEKLIKLIGNRKYSIPHQWYYHAPWLIIIDGVESRRMLSRARANLFYHLPSYLKTFFPPLFSSGGATIASAGKKRRRCDQAPSFLSIFFHRLPRKKKFVSLHLSACTRTLTFQSHLLETRESATKVFNATAPYNTDKKAQKGVRTSKSLEAWNDKKTNIRAYGKDSN